MSIILLSGANATFTEFTAACKALLCFKKYLGFYNLSGYCASFYENESEAMVASAILPYFAQHLYKWMYPLQISVSA